MTLGPSQKITVDGETAEVSPDNFTKLLIYKDRPGLSDGNEAIKQALAKMRSSHCAIRAVGEIVAREVKSISFGDTPDPHANYACQSMAYTSDKHYSMSAQTILVNKEKRYLYDVDNLVKVLYHEGLHHIECTRLATLPKSDPYNTYAKGTCNFGADGMHYHNPECVERILASVLPAGDACLQLIGDGGALFNPDGKPLEPNYPETASHSASREEQPRMPSVRLPDGCVDFN